MADQWNNQPPPQNIRTKKSPVVISFRKKQIKKKPALVKFPTGSDHCDQSEDEDVPLSKLRQEDTPQPAARPPQRQDLRVKLNKMARHSTPALINDKGPAESWLRRDPWQPGCAPKWNRAPQPFLEGQARNCPEVPRDQWQQDGNKERQWFNPELCTSDKENEDDITTDELGTAELSKEDN